MRGGAVGEDRAAALGGADGAVGGAGGRSGDGVTVEGTRSVVGARGQRSRGARGGRSAAVSTRPWLRRGVSRPDEPGMEGGPLCVHTYVGTASVWGMGAADGEEGGAA